MVPQSGYGIRGRRLLRHQRLRAAGFNQPEGQLWKLGIRSTAGVNHHVRLCDPDTQNRRHADLRSQGLASLWNYHAAGWVSRATSDFRRRKRSWELSHSLQLRWADSLSAPRLHPALCFRQFILRTCPRNIWQLPARSPGSPGLELLGYVSAKDVQAGREVRVPISNQLL